MRCGFCGRDLPDEVGREGEACGGCRGGCRKVHCPHCGYANPAIPTFLRRRGKKKDNGKDETE